MMSVFVFCSWDFAKAARHYTTQGKTERVDLNLRIKRNSCDEKATGFGALSCCACPGFPGFLGFSRSPKEK